MHKNLRLYLIVIFIGCISFANATATGDYRSQGSGSWETPATWQRFNGSTWVTAVTAPTATDGVITILTGDSISVTNTTDTTFADQVVIKAGAILEIKTTKFVLLNGAGSDMQVQGKLMVDVSSNLSNRDNSLANRASIYYTGDTLVQYGGLTPNITFAGTNTQTIIGFGYFGFIYINNANNLVLATGNSFSQVNFQNGKLISKVGSVVFSQYSATPAFNGATTTKFIDGNVLYIAYDNSLLTATIPMGIGNRYLPVVFRTQKTGQDETHYNISLVDGPHTPLTLPSSIASVSQSRYITISSNHPETQVSTLLQINYDSLDNVFDSTRIRIVKSEGSNWVNVGGNGKGAPKGKINSSVNFTTLGDFALAITPSTSLPLNTTKAASNNGLPDVYKLTSNGDGRIKLVLKSTSGTGLNLKMLDKDSNTVISTTNVSAFTSGIGGKDGLAAGVYYVIVTPSAAVPYSYSIQDSLFAPVLANNIEPDSTRALARTLALNSQTTGHIGYYYNVHRDTTDWYKVTTTGDGLIKLGITSATGNAITMKLLDNNGTTVLGSVNSSGTTSTLLSKDGLAAGTYYVTVKMANTSIFSTYTLADTLVAAAGANDIEPNGTALIPDYLSVNSTTTGHIGYYYNQQRDTLDWYKIIRTGPGTMSFTIANNGSQRINVKWNNTPPPANSGWNEIPGNSNQAFPVPAAWDTVYISVYGNSPSNFSTYSILTHFTPGFAGSISSSNAATANEAAKKGLPGVSASVYPNPASSQLHVQYDASVVKAVLLKDMNGKTLWSEQKLVGQQHSIADVSKLPPGLYLLQIVNKDGSTTTKKVVISR